MALFYPPGVEEVSQQVGWARSSILSGGKRKYRRSRHFVKNMVIKRLEKFKIVFNWSPLNLIELDKKLKCLMKQKN